MVNKLTISNTITIFRLVIIVFINYWLATIPITFKTTLVFLALWIINAIGDILDGYYARLLNEETSFGEKLDVFADGVLVLGVYFILGFKGIVEYYMVCLVVVSYIQFILSSIYINIKTKCDFKSVPVYDIIGHITAIIIQIAIVIYILKDVVSFKIYPKIIDYTNLLILLLSTVTFVCRLLILLKIKNKIYVLNKKNIYREPKNYRRFLL